MFKVKLWLTVVLFIASGILLLLAGTPRLHELLVMPMESVASNAFAGLQGELIADSEQSVSRAAELANQEAVRALFATSKGTPDAATVRTELEKALAGRLGAPAFAAVADRGGSVKAWAGKEVLVDGNVAGYPPFADALTGVLRDGLVRVGDEAFHAAAAPVYVAQEPVGAVIIGWALSADYADALAKAVGHPVAILLGQRALGGSFAGIPSDQLKGAGLGTTFGDLSLDLPVTLPLDLPVLIDDRARYVAHGQALFGSDRSVSIVLGVDRTPALQSIALTQLAVVGATLLLAVLMLLMVVSILRSISKPVNIIIDHLSAHAQGTASGVLPEGALTGPFVRLGKQINMILQNPTSPVGARSGGFPVAPVSSPNPRAPGEPPSPSATSAVPVGPTPAAPASDDELRFEGIPGLGVSPTDGAPANGAASAEAVGGLGDALAPMSSAPVSESLGDSALSGLFDDDGGDPLAAFRVSPAPPTASVGAPATGMPSLPGLPGSGPMAEPPPSEEAADAGFNPEATVMFQVPQELLHESQVVRTETPSAPPPASPAPQATGSFFSPETGLLAEDDEGEAEEGRTVVAQIPQELLSAAAKPNQVQDAEQVHFREVYDEFIRTRLQCSEDTSELTYDRFVAKLLKNKQQIVDKYNSKSVRFQVYVKQGKAALRAVPVRD